jgi:hypothetical protein
MCTIPIGCIGPIKRGAKESGAKAEPIRMVRVGIQVEAELEPYRLAARHFASWRNPALFVRR